METITREPRSSEINLNVYQIAKNDEEFKQSKSLSRLQVLNEENSKNFSYRK